MSQGIRSMPLRVNLPLMPKGVEHTQYGFASHTEICQLFGKDYPEVVRQQAADKKLREANGLTLPALDGMEGDDQSPNVSVTL